MKVTVNHVVNDGCCSLGCLQPADGEVLLHLPEALINKGNLWVALAGCRDQNLKGEEIPDAGLSCLILQMVTGIKHRGVVSPVAGLSKEKAQMFTELFSLSFYSTSVFLLVSIHEQPQVNLYPESSLTSLPRTITSFPLELQTILKCFQVNTSRLRSGKIKRSVVIGA